MDTARVSAVSIMGIRCAEEPAAAVLQLKLAEFIKPCAIIPVPPSLNVSLLYLHHGHLSTNQIPQLIVFLFQFFVHNQQKSDYVPKTAIHSFRTADRIGIQVVEP